MTMQVGRQQDNVSYHPEKPKRSYWWIIFIGLTLLGLLIGTIVVILGSLGVIPLPASAIWLTIFGSVIIPVIGVVVTLVQSLTSALSRKTGAAQGDARNPTPPMSGTISPVGAPSSLQRVAEAQMKGEESSPLLPNQAPFDVAEMTLHPILFIGREDEKRRLLQQLREKGTGVVAALFGIAGIGKTSLAKEVARILYEEKCFPDGIIFVACEGKTDALKTLQDVLKRFDPNNRLPEMNSFAELSSAALRLLEGKKVLLILDNLEPELESSRLIAPLLAAGAVLLTTSRQTPSREIVPKEGRLEVGTLPPDEALTLFIQSLERPESDLAAAEMNAAQQIVEDLGAHTLAVKLTGRYAATSQRDIAALADEINEDPGRVLALRDDDLQLVVEIVFAKSVETLSQKEQHLFIVLAAFETTEFGRRAVLSLADAIGLQQDEAAQIFNLLVLRGLIEASLNKVMQAGSDRERLLLHPLIRAFALKRFKQYPEQQQRVALLAVASYYARYVRNEGILQNVLSYDEGNIIGSLIWTYTQKEYELVADLCSGMQYFWTDRGRVSDALSYLNWGIEAAEERANKTGTSHDQLRKVHLRFTYAKALQSTGKLDEAAAIYQEIGETEAEETLNGLGTIALDRSQLVEAETFLKKSLFVARLKGNQWSEGKTLSDLGQVARLRGNPDEAEKYFLESIAIRRRVHDWRGEAWDLNCLAEVALNRGQLDNAEKYYKQSLDLFVDQNDLFNEGIVRSNLGGIALRRGRLDEAEDYYKQSLSLRRKVSDKRGEGWDLASLGEVCRHRGKGAEADTYYQQSLILCQDIQDWRGVGIVLSFRGELALEEGRVDDAERCFQQSLPIRREVEDRRGEGADLTRLGQIAEKRNLLSKAEDYYQQSLRVRREVNIDPDTAETLLKYGRFLIMKRNMREEGCTFLEEAIRLYPEQWVPGKEEARKIARALQCLE